MVISMDFLARWISDDARLNKRHQLLSNPGKQLAEALAGESVGTSVKGTMNTDQGITKGDMFMAIDPGAVGSLEHFVRCVEELAAEVHASQPVPGVQKVLMPGEFERAFKAERLENGIAVPDDLLAEIRKLAE